MSRFCEERLGKDRFDVAYQRLKEMRLQADGGFLFFFFFVDLLLNCPCVQFNKRTKNLKCLKVCAVRSVLPSSSSWTSCTSSNQISSTKICTETIDIDKMQGFQVHFIGNMAAIREINVCDNLRLQGDYALMQTMSTAFKFRVLSTE